MSAELHSKILGFLATAFGRKEGGQQCVGIDLEYAPGSGFKNELLRKWSRTDEPELFDVPGNLVHVEKLVSTIIEIAESEADAKPPGKHRFVLRSREHLGGAPTMSFAVSPTFNGDDTALVPMTGGGRGDPGMNASVIAGHAAQLMRINAQMFDGTIRVLGQQHMSLHEQVVVLTAENATLRKELEEARSNKMDREFQIAMAAEKNARTNAGFQKLLQIGTVVAAKIGGADEIAEGEPTPLAMLIAEFGKSLRKDQIGVLMNTLDVAQKMMFMEIMNMVNPPEKPGEGKSGTLPSNGAAP